MEEIWKNIKDDYTRKYQASSLGRIRSLDFVFIHPGPGSMKNATITRKGQLVNTAPDRKHPYGRFSPTLKSGNRKELLVHHVIAETFIGPRPDGMWVLHKNGNSGDNGFENLYYGTPSQNTHDAYKHGTLNLGEKHHKAKLTKEQVMEIFLSKERPCVLAKRFGVDDAIPQLIRKGKIWKSVTQAPLVVDFLNHESSLAESACHV